MNGPGAKGGKDASHTLLCACLRVLGDEGTQWEAVSRPAEGGLIIVSGCKDVWCPENDTERQLQRLKEIIIRVWLKKKRMRTPAVAL